MSSSFQPRLRVEVEPHEDELPLSFFSRLARANGFESLGEFTRFTEVSIVELLTIKGDFLWSPVSLNPLRKFALTKGLVIPFGSTTVKRSQLQRIGVRYCPHCLRDDLENYGGNPTARSYLRASWSWRMVATCPVHRRLLWVCNIECAALEDFAGLPEGTWDFTPSQGLSRADEYFTGRLMNSVTSGFLDSFPGYVAAEICTLIGLFKKRLDGGNLSGEITDDFMNYECRALGFEIAECGRQALWDFLTDYAFRTRELVRHPQQVYAPVLRWRYNNRKNPDYAEVSAFFQAHARAHMHLKGHEVLTQPPENSGPRRIFSWREVHRSRGENQGLLTTLEAARLLGCSRWHVDQLVFVRLISAVLSDSPADRSYLITKEDVETLHQRLLAAVPLDTPLDKLEPIGRVSKLLNRSFGEIMLLILDGKVTRLACMSPALRVDEIMLDADEVRSLLAPRKSSYQKVRSTAERRPRESSLTFRQAARLLCINQVTMTEILKRRYLPCFTTPRGKHWIERSDLEAFASSHVSLLQVAKKHGWSCGALRKELEGRGARPLFPAGRSTDFIFTRSAVDAAGFP